MIERLLGFPQRFALGGRLQRSQRAQWERTARSGRTRDDIVIHSVGDVRYIDRFPPTLNSTARCQPVVTAAGRGVLA